MNTSISVMDILLYSIPSIAIISIFALYFGFKFYKSAKNFVSYKNDDYRLSLERQIADLGKQLTYNEMRFKELNHLLIDGQNAYKSSTSSNKFSKPNFFSDIGIDLNIPVDNKLIFVLAPFNPDSFESYAAIKSIVESLGFKCSRGDEDYVSNNILSHILREVVKAKLVIADITGRNPNVFYELGIAHALGKPVLIIAQTYEDIPFDLKHLRILTYSNLNRFKKELSVWLLDILLENRLTSGSS